MNEPIKLYLHRVRLNSGGYTSDGSYFGTGQPLWEYFDDNYSLMVRYVRADDRDHAKAKIIAARPSYTFTFYR